MPTINVYIRSADVALFEEWKKLLAEQRRSMSAAIAEAAEAAINRSEKEAEAQRTDRVARNDSGKESDRRNRSAAKRRGAVSKDPKRDGTRETGKAEERKTR